MSRILATAAVVAVLLGIARMEDADAQARTPDTGGTTATTIEAGTANVRGPGLADASAEAQARRDDAEAARQERNNEVLEDMRSRALTHIERFSERLDAVTERLQSRPLDDDTAAWIESRAAEIAGALGSVESSVAAATSGEELRAAVAELRALHRGLPSMHLRLGLSAALRATQRMHTVAGRYEEALARLQEAGVDITAATEALEKARSHLMAADAHTEAARDGFSNDTDTDAVKAELRGAREDLQAARDTLRESLRSLREARRSQ